MPRGEIRVVAANLVARALGVVQKIEVVNRHDPGSPACGNQKRGGGVRDVQRADEPLDRRKFQTVPREVETPDRDPRVDDARARQADRGETIFPGAREERQRVVGGALAVERGSELMHVFPDAGALPERGAIVQQNAHLGAMVAQRLVATTPYTSIN